ncbi:hypothetical protein [Halorientalis pallida]|uniref:Uncharacterized protein n=1 Tax=Halorientalis pallida TaxID=2479928 RepID=A0A498L0H8_9EURY|nr:hypothetical protein [Halorientalis pallida]RXK50343.1 hypothetical protein EAF64_07220 [Halorientalis pallida]
MVHTPRPDPEPVLADLRDRGFEVTRLSGDGPAAVAVDGSAPDAVTDRPLAVEPLAGRSGVGGRSALGGDTLALTAVARLAAAARDGQATLFVAAPETAAAVRELLTDPFLCRADTDGRRTFYTVPDRIMLTDDSYACVRADEAVTWREEPTAGPGADESDATRLVCAADGTVRAALESVDSLRCPGPDPAAFPYRYSRGEDRQMHVFDHEREIGTFTGVAAMKAHGYRPVPLPLVPEHHLRESTHLGRAWTVATVTDGSVRYDTA